MNFRSCRRGLLPVVVSAFLLVSMRQHTVQAAPPDARRFLQKSSLHVVDQNFGAVVAQLAEQEHLKMTLDPSIAEGGIDKDHVTLDLEGISLGSLFTILSESVLASIRCNIEKDGEVVFLTSDADLTHLVDVSYRLTDLGPLAANREELVDAILNCTVELWQELDSVGGQIVAFDAGILKVRQTQLAQKKVAAILEQLAAAVRGRPAPATPVSLANDRLAKQLTKRSPVPAGDVPLKEFLDAALAKQKIPYVLDPECLSLVRATVGSDGKRLPLHETLTAALKPLNLCFVIEDEVVKITSQDLLYAHTLIRVYDVRKLVSPAQSAQSISQKLEETAEVGPWSATQPGGGVSRAVGPYLVITQTAASHQKISQLLYGR